MSREIANCILSLSVGLVTESRERHTVDLRARVDNAARSMAKNCIVRAVLLTQTGFLMFPFFHIVDLHGIVTFGREKQLSCIIKVDREDSIRRGTLADRCAGKVLNIISCEYLAKDNQTDLYATEQTYDLGHFGCADRSIRRFSMRTHRRVNVEVQRGGSHRYWPIMVV